MQLAYVSNTLTETEDAHLAIELEEKSMTKLLVLVNVTTGQEDKIMASVNPTDVPPFNRL